MTMAADPEPMPTKAELTDNIEVILKRLRKSFLSASQAPPLTAIEPEEWAVACRKLVPKATADEDMEPFSPLQNTWLFPTGSDLYALDESVEKLAKAIGVVRFGYKEWLSIFKRVEHDYHRLKLTTFAKDLARRVASVPEPPLTKLAKILSGKVNDIERETISELYLMLGGNRRLLGGNYRAPKQQSKIRWEKFETWLTRLTSPSFNKALPRGPLLEPECFTKLAFRDVLCQQQLWRTCYGVCLDSTVQWLHKLLDEEIDTLLRTRLHGRIRRPDGILTENNKAAARFRQREYREREKIRQKVSQIA